MDADLAAILPPLQPCLHLLIGERGPPARFAAEEKPQLPPPFPGSPSVRPGRSAASSQVWQSPVPAPATLPGARSARRGAGKGCTHSAARDPRAASPAPPPAQEPPSLAGASAARQSWWRRQELPGGAGRRGAGDSPVAPPLPGAKLFRRAREAAARDQVPGDGWRPRPYR